MRSIKKFIMNAVMLTSVSLIMRTISVGFNVYVSNKVGAEAMGLFSLLGSVYGFGVTFATSGINLATTRMISEALGKNDEAKLKASMKRCLAYAAFFGFLGAFLLFSSARYIGVSILDEERAVTSLRILSLTLPFISISSSVSGYITAVRRVYKNAAVQLSEQGVKIFATVFLLSIFMPKGIEYACLALVLGGALAECLSCLVLSVIYAFDARKHFKTSRSSKTDKSITRRLLGISLPVALSTYIRSALVTFEHILIPIGLRKSGATRERSLEAYGILGSMVLPIILFPSALIGSFSGLLIPELSEYNVRGNKVEIKYITSRVFQMSLIFSIGVSGIIMCYSYELGMLIYSSSEAAEYIRLLAPLIPVMYFDSTVDAMLKGLGQQIYSMNVNILDATLSVVLVWSLLPIFGIRGYIITIYISEIFNASLSIVRLLNITGIKPRLCKWVAKPLLSVVGATTLSRLCRGLFFPDFIPHSDFDVISQIMLSSVLYLSLVCLTSSLDKNDLHWLISIIKKDNKKEAVTD